MSAATIIIAKTIQGQIGMNSLMCIGAHKFIAIPETDKHLGGLQFKLGKNPKMKQGGTVTITLLPSDTYAVKIITSRGKVMLDVEGIYCEDLGGQSGVIEGVTG